MRILLATDPDVLSLVPGVAYRSISRLLIHNAGLTRATGGTGAVTLVQRFGRVRGIDAIVCINLIHIAPWEAALALPAEASRLLRGLANLCHLRAAPIRDALAVCHGIDPV